MKIIAACAATFLLTITTQPAAAASAIAITESFGGRTVFYWIVNASSTATAEKAVMNECVQKSGAGAADNCRLVGVDRGPGYLSVFQAANGRGIGYSLSINRQESIDLAYTHCASNHGTCPTSAAVVVWDGGPTSMADPLAPQRVETTRGSDMDRLKAMSQRRFKSGYGMKTLGSN